MVFGISGHLVALLHLRDGGISIDFPQNYQCPVRKNVHTNSTEFPQNCHRISTEYAHMFNILYAAFQHHFHRIFTEFPVNSFIRSPVEPHAAAHAAFGGAPCNHQCDGNPSSSGATKTRSLGRKIGPVEMMFMSRCFCLRTCRSDLAPLHSCLADRFDKARFLHVFDGGNCFFHTKTCSFFESLPLWP